MVASLLLAIPFLAPLQQEEFPYAEIANDHVVLHAFYDSKSAEVLELDRGVPVQIVAEFAPWSKVRVPSGLDVWVHKDYVAWDGGAGAITGRRVRIRPLPSTAAASTPLGHFSKGDVVLRLAEDGDWFQVRAPETVSAWLLTKHLKTPERENGAWQSLWKKHRSLRRIEPVMEVEEVIIEEVVEVVPVPEVLVVESKAVVLPAETIVEAVDHGSYIAPQSSYVAPTNEHWPLYRSVDVAKEPEQLRNRAAARLEELASQVIVDFNAWDRRRLDNMEMVFTNVVWHSVDMRTIDAARASLTRIDGLRRYYYRELESQVRRATSVNQHGQAATLERRLIAEKQPMVYIGDATSVELGWVEYHPSANSDMPYRLVRGGRDLPMHSFDGHQDLHEFVNREIVVRGVWLEESSLDVGRVLAITELRVLPSRK